MYSRCTQQPTFHRENYYFRISEVIKNKFPTLSCKPEIKYSQPKNTEPEKITYPHQYIFKNAWILNLFCLTLEWWLENNMIRTSLSKSKFILANENRHSTKCHSPLLLFHAGHYTGISRQFTYSIFCYNSCHHLWSENTTGLKNLTSHHKAKLFNTFCKLIWTSSLIFSWHSDSWTGFSGEIYFQFP